MITTMSCTCTLCHYDCMYTDALDVIDKINIIPHHPGHYFCLVCPKKQVIDFVWPKEV